MKSSTFELGLILQKRVVRIVNKELKLLKVEANIFIAMIFYVSL